MDKVIVLGNDHTNSLGIVQCLGRSGFQMIAFVWGVKTGFVKSSIYAKEVHTAKDVQSYIDLMLQLYGDNEKKIPIIACCDTAALALERNSDRLQNVFLYEYSISYTLDYLAKKENQVRLAVEADFEVPKTWNLNDSKVVPKDVTFPCLIKPLVSCEGAKSDIKICRTIEELQHNLNNLQFTKCVILQQYIERDYEISILGCGLKNGDVIIPCVENKLTLYPRNVGLECLANIQPLKDMQIVNSIELFIKTIGYVGVFSVEMMHCKKDNKYYFTEINLRNDGANGFVYKYGANLPLNHIEDLLGRPLTEFTKFNSGYYIWEMHHLQSLLHREITLRQWFSELKKSRGFLVYFPEDKVPFYRQFVNSFMHLLRIKKIEYYM